MTENGEQKAPGKAPLILWFLAGLIPVLLLALIFTNALRCLFEYRLSDALVGLAALLVAGAAAGLGAVLPDEAQKAVWSAGGGVALALLVTMVVHLALPPIPPGECPNVTPTPAPTATPWPSSTPTVTPTLEPTATPHPNVWRCPEGTEGALYVASDESDIFHRLDCEWAAKIHPSNRLCFASYEAALNANFRPCQVCKPP